MRRTVLATALLALIAPASAQVIRADEKLFEASGDREVFGFVPPASALASAAR